jgi:hypothetical protein
MAQFAPAASVVPQLFDDPNEDAFVPVTAMLVIDIAAPPVLVKVTCCEALVDPTAWFPNERLVTESDATGTVPVPPSVTLCGDPAALSVIAIAAVSAPDEDGVNCAWIVQFAPAASVVPQLFDDPNEDAFVPVTPMLVIDTAAPPVLVNVTCCEALVVPTAWFPNERLL